MKKIEAQPSIEIMESIVDRIQSIIDIADQYKIKEIVLKNLIINSSENNTKINYVLDVKKVKFEEYPEFQMKLSEMAFAEEDLTKTQISSYSYHGFHLDQPKKDFIRFDFEPFKEKYAPVHINAYKQRWGDHLVFPDDTNLDISKMSCPIAVRIFNRYAKDKNDFPANKDTNEAYVQIIKNGGELYG